jgi:hypothetical protein
VVFDAVCAETGRLVGAGHVNLARFTADGFWVAVAEGSLRDTHLETGTRIPLEGDSVSAIASRTVAPARMDSYEQAAGELAAPPRSVVWRLFR